MELDLALLADAANTSSEGKLNILGEFNALFTPSNGPVPMPPFVLVLRLLAHAGEAGPHTLGIRLRDGDGSLLWSSPDLKIEIPEPPLKGHPVRFQFLAAGGGIALPGEGTYEFEIVVDAAPAKNREGQRAKGAEVHVFLRPTPPEEGVT